ncbi:MAG: 3-phosphoshikimate 1-carboxyvinyltransferase, partial [Candidatus Limnocylindria bacterium]
MRIAVPASKSVANRELVLAAIAEGRSVVELGTLDPGDDVRAMRTALATLGYETRLEPGGRVLVRGRARAAPPADVRVDCAEAGTVARFGLALAALGEGRVELDGSARLRERPIAPLVRALREIGAVIDGERLPLVVRGTARGGEVTVPGEQSSQFASALLLIAPRLRDGLRLRVSGALVSAPYVELTVAALRARGVRVERPSP